MSLRSKAKGIPDQHDEILECRGQQYKANDLSLEECRKHSPVYSTFTDLQMERLRDQLVGLADLFIRAGTARFRDFVRTDLTPANIDVAV